MQPCSQHWSCDQPSSLGQSCSHAVSFGPVAYLCRCGSQSKPVQKLCNLVNLDSLANQSYVADLGNAVILSKVVILSHVANLRCLANVDQVASLGHELIEVI
jgi:hypothetical protein